MALRIIAVRKQSVFYNSRYHTHISHVQVAGGAWYTRAQVIQSIRTGEEFYTEVGGKRANVRWVRCPVCASDDYITTAPDGSTANNLDDLPER